MNFLFRSSIELNDNSVLNISEKGISLLTDLKKDGEKKDINLYKESSIKESFTKASPYRRTYIIIFAIFVFIFVKARIWFLTVISVLLTMFIIKAVTNNVNRSYLVYNSVLKEKDPNNREALLGLAKNLYNENDLVNNMLAVFSHNKKDGISTLRYIRDIDDFDDLSELFLLRLKGTAMYEEGQYEEIIKSLTPEMDRYLLFRLFVALAYRKLGDYDKSIEVLENAHFSAIEDDTNLTFDYFLGLNYLDISSKEAAIEHLKKVYYKNHNYADIKKYALKYGFHDPEFEDEVSKVEENKNKKEKTGFFKRKKK